METVFRIRDIEKLPIGVWKVQLSLDGDEDIQLRRLTEHTRAELQGSHPLFTLGRLMKTLGQYGNAEHFYRMLMTETQSFSSNPAKQAKLYSDLGIIYKGKRLFSHTLSNIFSSH